MATVDYDALYKLLDQLGQNAADIKSTIITMQQATAEVVANSARIDQNVGTAAISMRDRIVTVLRQWNAQPLWMADRISNFQLQEDKDGNYVRDQNGNFSIL